MQNTIKAISPYIYSGAIRSGTSHAIDAARSSLVHAAADHPAIQEFLESSVGDALLRLALAGMLAIRDIPRLAEVQGDIRNELLVSASAAGFDALFSGLLEGGKFLHEKLTAVTEPADDWKTIERAEQEYVKGTGPLPVERD